MLFETVISNIKNSNNQARKSTKTILNMQNFHFKKLLAIRKNLTLRKKSQKIRTLPKNPGKL